MITKAIIEEIVDKYKVKVRVPFYNKANESTASTPFSELCTATICVPPGCNAHYKVGDVVFVGFEDHHVSKPIVLGQLYRASVPESYIDINAGTLKSNSDSYLPSYTFIGDISPDEISTLKGVNSNLKLQLEILEQRIAKLDEQIQNQRIHTYGILINESEKELPTQEDLDFLINVVTNSLSLEGWQKKAADINSDGIIDASDITLLENFINNPTLGQYGSAGQKFFYNGG